MKIDQNLINKAIEAAVKFVARYLEKPVQPIVVMEQVPQVEAPKAPMIVPTVNTVAVIKPVVDWSNHAFKISEHFTVGEATELRSWNAFHNPSDAEKASILELAEKMDQALAIIAKEINKEAKASVHAWMRPAKANIPGNPHDGQDYNAYIYDTQVWAGLSAEEKAKKVVPSSPHRDGKAIDFHVPGFEGAEGCAKIRKIMLPHLEALGMRMEDHNGGWVHLDVRELGPGGRFFKA